MNFSTTTCKIHDILGDFFVFTKKLKIIQGCHEFSTLQIVVQKYCVCGTKE